MDPPQTQTPVEHLYRELDELRLRNADRKAEISTLGRRIEQTLGERDALNEEVGRISAEIKKLKAKRDSLNAEVKGLKTKRDELRNEAAKKRETLSKLLEQARGISEQLRGNMSDIATQIQRLEWYIQTNPLSTQAERNLIAKIGALEANLAKHKGLKNVRESLLRLKIEVGALRIQAQTTHEELTRIASESEKTHAAMQALVKVLVEKKKEADQKHANFLEQSKQRHEAVSTLKSDLLRMEQIRLEIAKTKTSSKFEKAEKVKSKYKAAANEKLRTGGKLSLEEFQALMGDSLSESEDE
jgi:uncharacterized coiled-coil DUF342 family protein